MHHKIMRATLRINIFIKKHYHEVGSEK